MMRQPEFFDFDDRIKRQSDLSDRLETLAERWISRCSDPNSTWL
ncbi:MAG: hypothetical protein AAF160_07695 [Pseudomonadota bacterium]